MHSLQQNWCSVTLPILGLHSIRMLCSLMSKNAKRNWCYQSHLKSKTIEFIKMYTNANCFHAANVYLAIFAVYLTNFVTIMTVDTVVNWYWIKFSLTTILDCWHHFRQEMMASHLLRRRFSLMCQNSKKLILSQFSILNSSLYLHNQSVDLVLMSAPYFHWMINALMAVETNLFARVTKKSVPFWVAAR